MYRGFLSMKLHVTYTKQKEINGYLNIDILDANQVEELKNISTSSCSDIIISECLQIKEYEQSISILQQILSKLRKNGEIHMSIIDIDSFAVDIANSSITDGEISSLLYHCNSCIGLDKIKKEFKNFGITLQSLEQREYFFVINGKRI